MEIEEKRGFPEQVENTLFSIDGSVFQLTAGKKVEIETIGFIITFIGVCAFASIPS